APAPRLRPAAAHAPPPQPGGGAGRDGRGRDGGEQARHPGRDAALPQPGGGPQGRQRGASSATPVRRAPQPPRAQPRHPGLRPHPGPGARAAALRLLPLGAPA
ncbi:Protein of unknown function, partial [Gryllus bimaculatus]